MKTDWKYVYNNKVLSRVLTRGVWQQFITLNDLLTSPQQRTGYNNDRPLNISIKQYIHLQYTSPSFSVKVVESNFLLHNMHVKHKEWYTCKTCRQVIDWLIESCLMVHQHSCSVTLQLHKWNNWLSTCMTYFLNYYASANTNTKWSHTPYWLQFHLLQIRFNVKPETLNIN